MRLNFSKPLVATFLASAFLLQACSPETPAQETPQSQALVDLEILASDEMEGRRAGTPGSVKAQTYIIERLEQIGVPALYDDYKVSFDFERRQKDAPSIPMTGVNIFGKIAGKSSDHTMVVSAHYDHLGERDGDIYNGADDNASGVVGVLAIAEHFMKNQPEYDVIIALFDAEEMGLQGARAYVNGFEGIEKVVTFNMNLDMISRDINDELYMSGIYHYPSLAPLGEQLSTMGKVTLKAGKDVPGTGSADWTMASDHGAFHMKKIPFIYFGVDFHPDYHKPTDTYENATKDFFSRAVETVVISAEFLDENLAKITQ